MLLCPIRLALCKSQGPVYVPKTSKNPMFKVSGSKTILLAVFGPETSIIGYLDPLGVGGLGASMHFEVFFSTTGRCRVAKLMGVNTKHLPGPQKYVTS